MYSLYSEHVFAWGFCATDINFNPLCANSLICLMIMCAFWVHTCYVLLSLCCSHWSDNISLMLIYFICLSFLQQLLLKLNAPQYTMLPVSQYVFHCLRNIKNVFQPQVLRMAYTSRRKLTCKKVKMLCLK